jgi:hypothetical protein
MTIFSPLPGAEDLKLNDGLLVLTLLALLIARGELEKR